MPLAARFFWCHMLTRFPTEYYRKFSFGASARGWPPIVERGSNVERACRTRWATHDINADIVLIIDAPFSADAPLSSQVVDFDNQHEKAWFTQHTS